MYLIYSSYLSISSYRFLSWSYIFYTYPIKPFAKRAMPYYSTIVNHPAICMFSKRTLRASHIRNTYSSTNRFMTSEATVIQLFLGSGVRYIIYIFCEIKIYEKHQDDIYVFHLLLVLNSHFSLIVDCRL